MTQPLDLPALEAAARAALDAEAYEAWFAENVLASLHAISGPDAAHIAAANPATVLALVERVRVLEEATQHGIQQIPYLHDKFRATGSGNAVLAKMRAALEPQP